MSKILFFIGFVCVIQVASSGRLVREAPATTNTLNDLTEKAKTAYNTLQDTVLKIANVNSTAELGTLVQTQSEKYADQLKTLAGQMGEQIAANSDSTNSFFTSIANSLTEVANTLTAGNTDLSSLQSKLGTSIKSVLDETEKLNAKLKVDGKGLSEAGEKIMKEVYEDTAEVAKKAAAAINDAVQKV